MNTKEWDLKRTDLIAYTKLEADMYASGVKGVKLSPVQELSERFGYTTKSAQRLFVQKKIGSYRRTRENEFRNLPFPPSEDLAWLVGYLAGSSFISQQRNASLVVGVKNPYIQEKFATTIQTVFGLKEKPKPKNKPSSTYIQVNSKTNVKKLGDVSSLTGFPKTYQQRYEWIESNQRYLWNFLSGMLDSRGEVQVGGLRFNAANNDFVNLIVHSLQMVGVQNPRCYPANSDKKILVAILNAKDQRLVATHLTSADPARQLVLNMFKEKQDRYPSKTDSELLAEWYSIKDELGYPVLFDKIDDLRKKDKKISTQGVYERTFGDKTRSTTRRVLNNLYLFERATRPSENTISAGEKRLLLCLAFARKPYLQDESPDEIRSLGNHLNALMAAEELIDNLKINRNRFARLDVNIDQAIDALTRRIQKAEEQKTLEQAKIVCEFTESLVRRLLKNFLQKLNQK